MNTVIRFTFAACATICTLASTPISAQTPSEEEKVIAAIRQNGCVATEADMDRIFPSLDMDRHTVEQILENYMVSGEITFDGEQGKLSDALCSGKTTNAAGD